MKKLLLFILIVLSLLAFKPNNEVVYLSLMLDFSSSMSNEKVSALKESVKSFIDLAATPCTKISIYTFGGNNYHLPYTSDINEMKNFIDTLKSSGGTPLYSCLNRLYSSGDSLPKAILLFTDGEPTDTKNFDLRKDIPVFCVGIGLDAKGESVLNDISKESGGEVTLTSELNSLQEIFKLLYFRMMSNPIDAMFLPYGDTTLIKESFKSNLSSTYFFNKAAVYCDDTTGLQFYKDMIVETLKEENCPNAIAFGEDSLQILTINNDNNQSLWQKGSYNLAGNHIYITYDKYDIVFRIVNNEENLALRIMSFKKNGIQQLSDEDYIIYIFLKSSYCFDPFSAYEQN